MQQRSVDPPRRLAVQVVGRNPPGCSSGGHPPWYEPPVRKVQFTDL
jgi:hypothetical protein